MAQLKGQWKTETQTEIELRVQKELKSARQKWQHEQETVNDDGSLSLTYFLRDAKEGLIS